ncbi:glycoside hydrolase family 3 protein [Piscirickettsia litoralis]|uniref:beta-glucosidase n=1 Tax=Piscirickettsia litoralis TaxID=1891921 RepID=A0ABX3A3X7_9GAMM|nr:glycoside hydrolase family 3 N-terminal domain-containing protein [Piscirickettsia litoralis]ODN43562.1 hypothetical protein BGC07_12370 [Piscirickettsia litoralis]
MSFTIKCILPISLLSCCSYSLAFLPYSHYASEANKVIAAVCPTPNNSISSAHCIDFLIGQSMLASSGLVDGMPKSKILQYKIGGFFVGGNNAPKEAIQKDAKAIHTNLNPLTDTNILKHYSTLSNWRSLSQFLNQPVIVKNKSGQEYKIFPLLGTDAVHGNQHILGSVLFPQNIALGATHDPSLIREIGRYTSEDVKKSGVNWAFAPTLAIAHNLNWGRSYESFSSDPSIVKALAKSYILGMQYPRYKTTQNNITGILATAKHYIGDGNTEHGQDEGHVKLNKQNVSTFYKENIPGYIGAIDGANVGSVMVSYSSITGVGSNSGRYVPMTVNTTYLRHGLLDGENPNQLKFSGLVVSDDIATDRAANQGWPTQSPKANPFQHNKNSDERYQHALLHAENAGIDMFMMDTFSSYKTIDQFKTDFSKLLKSNHPSTQSLDINALKDHVKRILEIKLAMGLIQGIHISVKNNHYKKPLSLKGQNNQAAAVIAQKAALESFVLLKNNHRIQPINQHNYQYIILLGNHEHLPQIEGGETVYDYNNIGMQNGGWTIRWQGYLGNTFWRGQNKKESYATSLLDGMIKNLNSQQKLAIVVDKLKDKQLFPSKLSPSLVVLTLNELQGYINQYQLTGANTLAIGSLGEYPYAEYMGDVCNNNPLYKNSAGSMQNPYLAAREKSNLKLGYDKSALQAIKQLKNSHIPLLSVVYSGRPVTLQQKGWGNSPWLLSDAIIAAWLPGTSGGAAMADYLYNGKDTAVTALGKTNTLSFAWDHPKLARGTGLNF